MINKQNHYDLLFPDNTTTGIFTTVTMTVTMTIQIGCSEEIAEQAFAGLTFSCGSFRYEVMEEDVVVSLTTNRGGGK